MRVLPHTPLDSVLLAVAVATAVIIAVALQDFFIDSRSNPRIRALQDVGVAFAVTHLGGLVLLGSAGPRWAAAGSGMYVAAARREERQLEAHFGDAYRAYRSQASLILPSIPALVRSFR